MTLKLPYYFGNIFFIYGGDILHGMREGEINWDSTARWKLFMLLRLGSFELNWKWKKEKRSRDLRGLRKLLGLTFHLFHWRGIMTALRPGVCWHGLLCLTTSTSSTSSCCCCRLSSLLHAAAYSLSSMAWDLSPRHWQEIVSSPTSLLPLPSSFLSGKSERVSSWWQLDHWEECEISLLQYLSSH